MVFKSEIRNIFQRLINYLYSNYYTHVIKIIIKNCHSSGSGDRYYHIKSLEIQL